MTDDNWNFGWAKQASRANKVCDGIFGKKNKIVGPELCAVNGREQRRDNIYIFFSKKRKEKKMEKVM